MSYTIHKLLDGDWIEIINMSTEDLEFLKQKFPQFHPIHLEDTMTSVPHSKMDLTDEYMFMSEVVPVDIQYGKKTTNFEVSLFLTKNVLITTVMEESLFFKFEQQQGETVAGVQLHETPQLLMYRFLEQLYDTSAKTIDDITAAVQRMDDNILTITSTDTIREIAILQRNIICFITTLTISLPFFEELEQKNVTFDSTSMKEYWGDLIDKLQNQKAKLEDYEKILVALSSVHEIVVNTRTNRIITVLTIFSVIFLPLNLITGIYGMNFESLPLSNSPYGFLYTTLFMILVASVLFLYFKLRKWI